MARFSKRTLRILGDEFAGSWTLATIADLFDDAGFEFGDTSAAREVSGQRRGLATQYLSTLNLDHPYDIAKLVEVVNHVLFEMTHRSETEPSAVQFTERFIDQVRRDGFTLDDNHQIVGPRRSSSRPNCCRRSPMPLPSATICAASTTPSRPTRGWPSA